MRCRLECSEQCVGVQCRAGTTPTAYQRQLHVAAEAVRGSARAWPPQRALSHRVV